MVFLLFRLTFVDLVLDTCYSQGKGLKVKAVTGTW